MEHMDTDLEPKSLGERKNKKMWWNLLIAFIIAVIVWIILWFANFTIFRDASGNRNIWVIIGVAIIIGLIVLAILHYYNK